MKYITRIIEKILLPVNGKVFSEEATSVKITDDSGGEYLIISQVNSLSDNGNNEIRITSEEWPALRDLIEQMFSEIAQHKQSK